MLPLTLAGLGLGLISIAAPDLSQSLRDFLFWAGVAFLVAAFLWWGPIRDRALGSRGVFRLTQDELLNAINEGDELAGPFSAPTWDEVSYWTDATRDFIAAVLDARAKSRFDRVQSAADNQKLALARVEALREILNQLDPSQIRAGRRDVKRAVASRQAAPKDMADALMQEIEKASEG